ncbi:hypothetical protein SAMN04487968_10238 [Nocardioides terrae]|uniref:DUF4386 family protein n=1 Tax=Nocardioides terrae TaxID=574651 RepID=A0A1I1EDW7_9ACTN|nr:hypothetical protein [Nocardioides terrae]SFB85329.1 hypothetical protein SAMN04487968_10238 [Nocardioides terrae]
MTVQQSRVAFALLAVGGVAFNIGGSTHPSDDGTGSKTDQLHEMLVHHAWYSSHALLLVGFIGFAAGAWALRGRGGPAVQRLTAAVSVVAVVSVAGMVVHTLEPLGASTLADGQPNLLSVVATLNETGVDAVWGFAFAALATVGGLTRSIGNPVTAVLGLVGGAAFALASGTIPFTDSFDALFPVSGLLGVWAIVIGVWQLVAGRAVVPAA